MQQLPDMNELMKIARSPAGQKLLALLQSSSRSELDAIATEASTGNMHAAGQKLAGLLASDEAKALLRQLEKQQ